MNADKIIKSLFVPVTGDGTGLIIDDDMNDSIISTPLLSVNVFSVNGWSVSGGASGVNYTFMVHASHAACHHSSVLLHMTDHYFL